MLGRKGGRVGTYKRRITPMQLIRAVSMVTDIDDRDVRTVFRMLIAMIKRELKDGNVVTIDNLGHFFLDVKMRSFYFKHSYYGECDSEFIVMPSFRPSTPVASEFTNHFKGDIESFLNKVDEYISYLPESVQIDYKNFRDYYEGKDIKKIVKRKR